MLKQGKKVYTKVNEKLTPSGLWDNGLYYISDEEVLIPLGKLQQAITEDYTAKGVCCKVQRITIDGRSWLVIAQ